MRIFLTCIVLVFSIVSFSQTSGLFGTYASSEFEKFSILILEDNNRFTYKYGTGGCQGEVTGSWKVVDKKILFSNDTSFLNSKIVHYPNLGLTTWSIKKIGIIPDKPVDSGCLKESGLHLKNEVISNNDYQVSIVRLIASPEKYHERKVQVIGYMNLEFEGDAIYLHKEDFQRSLTKNGLWIRFSDNLNKIEIWKLNRKYVLIEGIFDMNRRGHMGAFSGEIFNITRITEWNFKR